MKLPGKRSKTRSKQRPQQSPRGKRKSPRSPSPVQKLTGSTGRLSESNARKLLEQNGIDINDPEFQRYLVLTGRSLDDVVSDLLERAEQDTANRPPEIGAQGDM